VTLSLNLEQKRAVIAELVAEISTAQAVVVAENRGLAVGDVTLLRANARKEGVYLRVVKNTLARRAVEGTPFAALASQLAGPLMYGIAKDPVASAKVLNDFAKTHEKLVIKAGAMPNYLMDADGVKALATMPSRDELIARLLATMQAPVGQFVRTLNEVPGRFVRTLAAVRDARESQPA
jgi:large subunit ribosomal protein L10